MGVLSKLFGLDKNESEVKSCSFSFVTGDSVFADTDERIYENYVIRSAIHAFATHAATLQLKLHGESRRDLENRIMFNPNPIMNLYTFLYRSATILSVNSTLFILPVEDDTGRIIGYYPTAPGFCEVTEHNGNLYLRYTLFDGSIRAVEYNRVGVVTNFAYDSVFFGGSNETALKPIINLINTQNQGLIKSIKNGAVLRFLGKVDQSLKEKDIKKLREQFNENLNISNNNGIGVYDNKFEEVIQLKPENGTLNSAQAKQTEETVYKYFGVPESIIKNQYSDSDLSAFLSGKIYPFALQLSEAMTNMTFSARERAAHNKIEFFLDILKYASADKKVEMAHGSVDRGIITINEARKILGLEHIDGCDCIVRRLDYGTTGEPAAKKEEKQ